jgi:hypothetical protein
MSELDERAIEAAAKALYESRPAKERANSQTYFQRWHELQSTSAREKALGEARTAVAAYLAACDQDGRELARLRQGMRERGFIVGRNPDGVDDSVEATLLLASDALLEAVVTPRTPIDVAGDEAEQLLHAQTPKQPACEITLTADDLDALRAGRASVERDGVRVYFD